MQSKQVESVSIIEEVRSWKRANAAKYNYDLRTLVQETRRNEAKNQHRLHVPLQSRPQA